jgi:hypothetical protein
MRIALLRACPYWIGAVEDVVDLVFIIYKTKNSFVLFRKSIAAPNPFHYSPLQNREGY